MSTTYRALALCALGLEKVLFTELERIGLAPESRSPGRVYFRADAAGLYRANLRLRSAERILLEAARFKAPDFDALFEGARGPAWEEFFGREDRLVIERVRSRNSTLSAQTSIQSVVHKAIYERLGRAYRLARLPETGRARSLRVYLEDEECVIGLDLSGEALHKRGYRHATGEAPLKETLAAGILLLAGYRRALPLFDPFCGSGTILIEAALIALDRAPGLDRHFELETTPLAQEGASSLFAAEREAAFARIRQDDELILFGSDADPRSLTLASSNAKRAGVADYLRLRSGAAEDMKPPSAKGILISNPPYGLRLGTEAEAEALYRRLGERYGGAPGAEASDFKGWGLGFVTNRPDFGSFFGRRAPVEHTIVNGAEEQWFHWYPAGWEERPPRAESVEAGPQAEPGRSPERPRYDKERSPQRPRPQSGRPEGGRPQGRRPEEPRRRDQGKPFSPGSRGGGPARGRRSSDPRAPGGRDRRG